MSALFTGEVTVPDVAAGLEKTSAIMQNASSLRAAQQKAKAAAYKSLEAKRTALTADLFGDSAWGNVPDSIRDTGMEGMSEYRDQLMDLMMVPGGDGFGRKLAEATAFLQSLGADGYENQRGAYIEGIGDVGINSGSVVMQTFTEDGLAEQDMIHRLTGATSRLGHDEQGRPTIMVTEQGSEIEVDHRQTQAYMGTSPYQPGVSLRAAIADQDIAGRYLGDYQREDLKFSEEKFNSDFKQYYYNEKGELKTAENMSVDSPEGGLFWKLLNKMSEMSERERSGVPPLERNLETYIALSSGDPNHPVNGEGFQALVPKAVDEIGESVKAIAAQQFDVTGRVTSEGGANSAAKKRHSGLLNSASEEPNAIPFVDEQGDARTLYGVSYTHKGLNGLRNLSIDNSESAREWDRDLENFINAEVDARIAEEPRLYDSKLAGKDKAAANIRAVEENAKNNYAESHDPRPVDETVISSVTSLWKTWDPVTEEYRLFVKGPKSDTKVGGQTSQGEYYYLPSTGEYDEAYRRVNNLLKSEYGFDGGFGDDDLQGGKGYEPPAPTQTATGQTWQQWAAEQEPGAPVDIRAFNASKN